MSFAAGPKIDPADVALLNNALAMEHALIKAYGDAVAGNALTPPVAAVLREFMNDHAAHRDALVAAIQKGGAAPTADTAPFQYPTLTSEGAALSVAYQLERIGANAYAGAIPSFKNRDYSGNAASILGVETTHVALLAEALKKGSPYPGGFVAP